MCRRVPESHFIRYFDCLLTDRAKVQSNDREKSFLFVGDVLIMRSDLGLL